MKRRSKVSPDQQFLFEIHTMEFEGETVESEIPKERRVTPNENEHYYLTQKCECTDRWVSSLGHVLCSRCYPNPYKRSPTWDYTKAMAELLAKNDAGGITRKSNNRI